MVWESRSLVSGNGRRRACASCCVTWGSLRRASIGHCMLPRLGCAEIHPSLPPVPPSKLLCWWTARLNRSVCRLPCSCFALPTDSAPGSHSPAPAHPSGSRHTAATSEETSGVVCPGYIARCCRVASGSASIGLFTQCTHLPRAVIRPTSRSCLDCRSRDAGALDSGLHMCTL